MRELPRAIAPGGNSEPREAMALAATLAGAAFDATGVTVAHALAQALGAVLGLPHGVAVALATPAALRFNLPSCEAICAELARRCGLAGESDAALAERFVAAVADLLQSVGLPSRVPLPPDPPADLADRLAGEAAETLPLAITLNPRKVDAASLRAMFGELGIPA